MMDLPSRAIHNVSALPPACLVLQTVPPMRAVGESLDKSDRVLQSETGRGQDT